jgi:hypothetical protein
MASKRSTISNQQNAISASKLLKVFDELLLVKVGFTRFVYPLYVLLSIFQGHLCCHHMLTHLVMSVY